MQTIVTHSGSFDPDDVLAVATLRLYLGEDNVEIIRSREVAVIAQADWAVDVGGVYDPEQHRFDHHQNGVPTRSNGVPYSAFGLLWEVIGEAVCGSKEVADDVSRKLVLPIDAADNHQTVCHPGLAGVNAVELFDVIDAIKPVRGSEESLDKQFLIAVDFGQFILERFISHAHAHRALREVINERYEVAGEKAVLQFDEYIPRHLLVEFKGVNIVVSPVSTPGVNQWMAATVPVKERGFQNRVVFPEAWAGLVGEELAAESGISGAVFCHKERYIFVADSKDGALKAARKAWM